MDAPNFKLFLPTLRSAGPYLLIELLLPGGTLLALLLWLSQGFAQGKFAIVHERDVAPSALELVIAAQPPRLQATAAC
ncbi:MAG: hypothetical protein V7640_4080 [Betaproteobacteria bacterium]|jgi:hypothetical protein